MAGVQSNQYSVWHRTGDSGFLDGLGRLWLTGRVNDTLSIDGNIIQPYPLEQALDNIEGISRTALISVDDELHLFVETTQQRIQPLSGVMQNKVDNVLTSAGIVDIHVNVIACMSVDGRHNSKIDRVTLRNTLQKTSR
ncbi:hypothetical protein ACU6U9_22495 [Pseudomonas sp. HK3]